MSDNYKEPPPADPNEKRTAYNGVTIDCEHKWDDPPCCGCGHGYGHGPWERPSWAQD